jgi:hypothetical protein
MALGPKRYALLYQDDMLIMNLARGQLVLLNVLIFIYVQPIHWSHAA